MPTVGDILAEKGSHLYSISPTATVLEAIHKMNQHGIGGLVVMADDQVVGMFTERDVLRRVLADNRDPATTPVGELMTAPVIYCPPDLDIEDASRIMKDKRIRHLPVCDRQGALLGLISIGDLNACHASHQEQTIYYLKEYIYGRG